MFSMSDLPAPAGTLALLLAMLGFAVLALTFECGRCAGTPDVNDERAANEAAEYFRSLRPLFDREDGPELFVTIDITRTPMLAAAAGRALAAPRPRRYDHCDDTCTVDCGHCKGAGKPADLEAARS